MARVRFKKVRGADDAMASIKDRITRAVRGTTTEAARVVVKEGRRDITSAPGNWGTRWPASLRADTEVNQSRGVVTVYSTIPYFKIFEYGGKIKGKPLLWIPLGFASDARNVMARDYPGGLFRVDRTGKAPLLLSRSTGEPKYFGKESVDIPQKFHIRETCRSVGRRVKDIYYRVYRSLKG
ncbi:hypothetical protein AUC68_11215 [Methyloceanibacter methanicus]|uniref:Tail protein n=1 Tax=Methyloceanibacter methanicus TaxID=1774968 RepID=A0A1E3VXR1_9HYPH|nr:DUF6441 family protein [Methyloceanibacter methanicus]ODR98061.1 hypothetical protein AUC68_11215 [Methyloceanibacter methanicus]